MAWYLGVVRCGINPQMRLGHCSSWCVESKRKILSGKTPNQDLSIKGHFLGGKYLCAENKGSWCARSPHTKIL
jgi:hypothetical protein